MNPEEKLTIDDETSSEPHEETSSSSTASSPTTASAIVASTTAINNAKRCVMKELIQRYFYQMQRGCGNPKCSNEYCASSGKMAPMTPNEIAAKAIQLCSQDAKLCETYACQATNKVARTNTTSKTIIPATATTIDVPHDSPTTSHNIANHITCHQDIDMFSPNESSSCSNSSNSTITSNSSKSSNTTNTTTTTTTSGGGGGDYGDRDDILNNFTSTQADDSSKESAMTMAASPLLEIIAIGSLLPKNMDISGSATSTKPSLSPQKTRLTQIDYINEQLFAELIVDIEKYDNCDRLLHVVNNVFPNIDKLSQSFVRQVSPTPTPLLIRNSTSSNKLHQLLAKSPCDLKKEDLRTLEGEIDKDEDSTQQQALMASSTTSSIWDAVEPMDAEEACTSSAAVAGAAALNDVEMQASKSETQVDLQSLRRVKKQLFGLNNQRVSEALNSSVIRLADSIKYGRNHDWEKVLHCFVICFDMATNTSNNYADLEYLERTLPKLCHAAATLPVASQARLARIWAAHCRDQLASLVQCCQQLITLQVILYEDSVQDNADVMAVTKVLKIAFYANILAGQVEKSILPGYNVDGINTNTSNSSDVAGNASAAAEDEDDLFVYNQISKPHLPKFAEDKLEKALEISTLDCRVPLMPYEEFYNEPLSEAIHMDRDYLMYKKLSDSLNEDVYFTFMLYSFMLTPATKVVALYYDSRIRMYSERNSSLYSFLNYFGDADESNSRPDLKLTVRRDNIIDDALIELELIAMTNPKDLKKQLVVEFMGEQGVDEGGVSKEFFQLIVEEIFNADFGMFIQQEETNTMWFNATPFENGAQFTLVGIILGLAIYNNIILAVNFPMVVYRKLMGGRGTFYDLKDWNPTLYRSLKSMLDYDENDMEEVFMQTFKISYNNVFGDVVEYELIQNGGDTVVGQHNKQEFVELYCDFLLNKSVEQQFKAFKKGFEMVTDESPLKLLFRPEEIELLVCGSRKFDFVELEKSTDYEGGYTAETQVIKDFWSVVHSMPEESKRKLLEFTTGSDRVPVGGLSRLKLLITRHGSDSDRLPTSHTCFNVLLLPEYNSKEKLEERLLKAINYSKGFGML